MTYEEWLAQSAASPPMTPPDRTNNVLPSREPTPLEWCQQEGAKPREALSWRRAKLLALDTETTGLDESAHLVQVGGYLCQGDPRQSKGTRLGTLVRPPCPIPVEAVKIHGITDELVADAPSAAQVADRVLWRIAHADAIVGYNWPFDRAVMARDLPGLEVALEGKPVLDALVLVRHVDRYVAGKGRHRLQAVAERLRLPRCQAHKASADAELALRVLWAHGAKVLPVGLEAASTWLQERAAEQNDDRREYLARTRRTT